MKTPEPGILRSGEKISDLILAKGQSAGDIMRPVTFRALHSMKNSNILSQCILSKNLALKIRKLKL